MKNVILVLVLAGAGYLGYNYYLTGKIPFLAALQPVSEAPAPTPNAVAVPPKVVVPRIPKPLPLDWTLTDGTVYKHVKVIKVEADSVTVLHHDGGARIDLYRLPQDLQDSLGYDPTKASLAAQSRAQADAATAAVLQAERNRAAQLKKQMQILGAQQQDAAITAINIVNAPAEVTTNGNTTTVKKIVKVTYDPDHPPTPEELQKAKPVWTDVTEK